MRLYLINRSESSHKQDQAENCLPFFKSCPAFQWPNEARANSICIPQMFSKSKKKKAFTEWFADGEYIVANMVS